MGNRHLGSGTSGLDGQINNRRAFEFSNRGLWLDDPCQKFWRLNEDWLQCPALNAVNVLADASGGAGPNAAAFAAYAAANKNFEVIGTNMTTALCSFALAAGSNGGGGITMQTAGADADQAILIPTTITKQSAWNAANLRTQFQPRFETQIRTGRPGVISNIARSTTTVTVTTSLVHNLSIGQSVTIAVATGPSAANILLVNGTFVVTAIGSTTTFTYTTTTSGTINSVSSTGSVTANNLKLQTIWSGLKLTNTDVIATDDDQFYARFLPTENSGNLQIVTSRAGTDLTTVLPVPVLPNTVYRLRFSISDLLMPSVRVNGVKYNLDGRNGESGDLGNVALTTNISLKPYTGTSANGTTPGTKAIDVLPGYSIQAAA